MKASFKLAGLAGALSLVLGGSVLANNGSDQAHGGLLSFTGWTATNGTIGYNTADVCAEASAYSCSEVAAGEGFVQLRVEAKTAGSATDDYIMTIVTEQNAGSDGTVTAGGPGMAFSDVSFIKMNIVLGGGAQNQTAGGIKSQQRINEFKNGTAFVSDTDINTGWSTADAPLVINQRLENQGNDEASVGDDFNSGFYYQTTNDENNVRNGYYMNIDQFVGMQDFALPNESSPEDAQSFSLRQRGGTFVNTTGSALIGADVMSWNAYTGADGETTPEVKAMWIGQKITAMSSDFGYMSLENMAVANSVIRDFDLTNAAAVEAWGTWADAGSEAEVMFGIAPTITVPVDPSQPVLTLPTGG